MPARRAALADERRVLHEVEVVGQHHQLAGAHGFVQAAGGVGLHQGLHAGRGQRVDRAFHRRHVTTFVGVAAAAQQRHLVRADAAEQQFAGVAGDAGLRKARQARVGQAQRVHHALRERRPAGAEQHGDVRAAAGGPQHLRGFVAHRGPS